MAVGILMIIPQGTQEMYNKTMQNLGLTAEGGDWPKELISHIAGPSGNDWVVVDTWESREAFEKFVQERLGKAVEGLGMPPMEPKFFDIYLSHKS